MRRSVAKLRGLGFIFWHARHEFYHVLLGLLWAWFLRERWGEFNHRWIWTSIFGSLLPDLDHFYYFLGYGKSAAYTSQIKSMLKNRQWRNVTVFVEAGHKREAYTATHNYYTMVLLLVVSLLSSRYEWETGVILFGAMLIHYLFDVTDDLLVLGRINPNWKRWGRGRS